LILTLFLATTKCWANPCTKSWRSSGSIRWGYS